MSGQDILKNSGFTGCLAKGGLVEGTNANTVQIAAPNGAGIDFAIDGVCYHKADTDNIAMTALAVQADLTTCLYLITLNSSGTVALTRGNEVVTANIGVVGGSAQWPSVAEDLCAIGGFKLVTSGATFTSGTDDLGGGSFVDTFYDFAVGIPLAPQV